MAVSIDHDSSPPTVLLIRGPVSINTVEGVAPEHAAMIRRTMSPADAQAYLDRATRLYPQMARIVIHPRWVGILDFVTRLPSSLERAMKQTDERSSLGTPHKTGARGEA